MMFLVQCLAIVVFAYGSGALVAEVVATSQPERSLPGAARALLGVLLVTIYFAAAWQLLSIEQSWILGIALLALHAVGNAARIRAADLRAALRGHALGCAAIVAGAVLFFAPLMVANEYGPFTEGGGDVTIYSDTAKLLTDGGMTAFGQASPDLRNVAPNVSALLDLRTKDRYTRYAHARDRFLEQHRDRLNPPTADVGVYRTVGDIFFSSIFYAPYAQFHFVSGALNYPAFYGMEAFFYAGLLACVWFFFRRFGRAPAWMALALVAGSHSLVSVYYNTYSMHAISLAVCASMLLLVGRVPVASWAGLRAYGCGLLIVWLCYTHFMSILVPILIAAAIASWRPARGAAASAAVGSTEWALRAARAVSTGVFLMLVALLAVGGSGKSIDFVSGLLKNFLTGAKSVYLGDQVSPLSMQWLWFLFGLVSQQHLAPFAYELKAVTVSDDIGAVAGLAALVLGVAMMARWWSRSAGDGVLRRPAALALYGLLLATVAVHMYLAQSSLYTQAKGAQNLLVVLYAALALPFALAWADPALARSRLALALRVALSALIVALAFSRAIYGYKLAQQMDRGSILDPSYFAAAERIVAADPHAFVLFEPRKSADLYIGIQPFSGGRMVPTRHLVLDRLIFHGRQVTKERVSVAQLVREEDGPHLWRLAFDKGAGAWRERRLLDEAGPRLVLFGDDYELAFGPRPRGRDKADVGTFSYVRNGDAMLVLPPGHGASAEIRLEPRDAPDRDKLLQALEAEGVPFAVDGDTAVIRRELPAGASARLVRLAGFSGQYWVNVRVDGAELK